MTTDIQDKQLIEQTEKISMALNLSIAQIDRSLEEGGDEISKLIENFNFMSSMLKQIQEHNLNILNKNQSDDIINEKSQMIQNTSASLQFQMNSTIIAFQFFDRMTQRLQHVSKSLDELTQLVQKDVSEQSPEQWEKFRSVVGKQVSMEEEQQLFEMIFDQNISAKQAVKKIKESIKYDEDEIELF